MLNERPFICECCGKIGLWLLLHEHQDICKHFGQCLTLQVSSNYKPQCICRNCVMLWSLWLLLGERPYVCKHCGKAFGRAHNLKQHELIHAGIKPYVCAVCQRSFSQPKTLTEHTRTHTGEKPFQCSHCLKLFVRYDNLKVRITSNRG